MKGFLARYHQALAIGASAGVLVIVGGTLTGIILAGRHSNPAIAGPTPTPTSNTNAPTLSPSQSANPSGSASASPGGTSTLPPGGPLATPIGFGNGGAGCLGLVNCTPAPQSTKTPVPAPAVTATYATPKSVANGSPVSVAALNATTILFTEGTTGFFGTVTSSGTPSEFKNPHVSVPMSVFVDGGRDHLWVIDALANSPAVTEFTASTFSSSAVPVATYSLPAGTFRSAVTASPPIANEGIAVDANGDVWFSEFAPGSQKIPSLGHVMAGGGGVESCALKLTQTGIQGGNPMSLAVVVSDTNVYIGTTKGLGVWHQSAPGASCTTGTYNEYAPVGCSTSGQTAYVESVAQGPDGKAWFGTSLGVGEFSSSSAVMVACNATGGLTGDHMSIVTAPDPSQSGSLALWAADSGTSATPGVARIFTSTGTPITTGGSGSDLRAMVKDSAGNLWIADAAHNQILEATPAKPH